ncbi:hypothetical protein FHW12_000665 [Dokdonella fugitiva]|uniref:F5/8 type C domain-containing protein n=1 Tax=Dokdonella fugitiva TaxID=328517 RepID=A0A839F2E7_9GAMM|nr:discoidin domain-containing protein [Dokdonella fugitiva]MBA8886474.1 hypothetical protein [Dokdonella fugitiva]
MRPHGSRSWFPACCRAVIGTVILLAASAATGRESDLPRRQQWRASSSSEQTAAVAPDKAIDGDPKTYWGGAFSPGHWFQVDLGRTAELGGVLIRWDSGFAHAYSIQLSLDGTAWTTAFETDDARGGVDDVFFPAARARYVRLCSPARTADWGVSVLEFEPLSAREAPHITGVEGRADPAALWRGAAPRTLAPRGSVRELVVELPRALPLAGLEVTWQRAPREARLDARDADGRWSPLAEDPGAPIDGSYLAAAQVRTASALRLRAGAGDGEAVAIRRLRLLGPDRTMTPMKRYEIAASRAHAALFPATLRARQVYWTVVGVPAGVQKSVFDEYGDLEAYKGAPLVQPLWRDAQGAVAAYDAALEHRLRDGWKPMPDVQWHPRRGLTLRSDAFAIEQDGHPVTLVRHRIANDGDAVVDGDLVLLVRPMQVSPPWQNGGPSPIREIAIEPAGTGSSVRVNGRVLLRSIDRPDAQGVAAFGPRGEGEITRDVVARTVPNASRVQDPDGLGAGLLSYRVHVAPGERRDVVLAFPLGHERFDTSAARLPDAPPFDDSAFAKDPAHAFDDAATRVSAQWQERLGGIRVQLPDRSLVDMLRAQAAYMLLNQTGPAMQPGPRNYNRSFIRDGSATAAVLLRMGMASSARDYLRWYARHAVHEDGLVSPILNDDGSVNRGFGSDLEYDSQGEFVWLVAEIARLDGGAATVRDYRPQVRSALEFLQRLRERTLVPGYMAGHDAPERFRGIIAPSISHEGYSTPTHSYWDDYWALKGWHNGAWLAQAWGDEATATWARAQYAALRESVAASIRATMRWKGADVIPASADLGDGDPAGVSIGLDPAGQQDLLPADALQRTFARYLDDVRKRGAPDALYAYTPYEMRNVLSYVHLGRPREAEELLSRLLRDRRPPEWHVLAEVVYSDPRHAIYLGDMPHTWIGSEYARALFGMLFHEGDGVLDVLPGTPPSWLDGDGLALGDVPTAYGRLGLRARRDGSRLSVSIDPGLRRDTALHVAWPSRERPSRVRVDGEEETGYDAAGIHLDRPFRELVAEWDG